MDQPAQWDIVTGVGFTALAVAALRAIETHRHPDGLVNDPYAAAFVKAAASPMPLPTQLDADLGTEVPWASMATYMGVRSKFFDDFFAGASAEGLDQVVLFAAGLDSRAFRLDWSPATTVYELDAPKVLEFKDRVLTDQGARAQCVRRTLAVDLREDWPSALLKAGFDPSRRTVWLAEGLLPFLPDDAKVGLFSRVHQLSPAGSRIAAEHISGDMTTLRQEIHGMAQKMILWMAQRTEVDMAGIPSAAESAAEFWPGEQNYDPAQWLASHGWEISTNQAPTVAHSYHRPLDDTTPLFHRSGLFLTAEAR
ncbi:MAG: SAM-dependent methyltransferase [Pseudonocardiaceae bacterium]